MPTSANAGVIIPTFQLDEQKHRQKISEWAKQVNQGHIKNVGTLTLAPSTVSTTVADARVGGSSFIGLSPTTANAASAVSSVFVSTVGVQTFTLTHASTASVDKKFTYCVLG